MSCGHAKSCINMFKLNSFVMLPIDQTSFKEKNVSLIRAATLGAGWVSVSSPFYWFTGRIVGLKRNCVVWSEELAAECADQEQRRQEPKGRACQRWKQRAAKAKYSWSVRAVHSPAVPRILCWTLILLLQMKIVPLIEFPMFSFGPGISCVAVSGLIFVLMSQLLFQFF